MISVRPAPCRTASITAKPSGPGNERSMMRSTGAPKRRSSPSASSPLRATRTPRLYGFRADRQTSIRGSTVSATMTYASSPARGADEPRVLFQALVSIRCTSHLLVHVAARHWLLPRIRAFQVHAHAILALALRAIQTLIRPADDVRGRIAGLDHRAANAHRQERKMRMLVDAFMRLRHVLPNAFGAGRRGRSIARRHENRELVAAVPGAHIEHPHGRSQNVPDHAEHGVARLVAVGIV